MLFVLFSRLLINWEICLSFVIKCLCSSSNCVFVSVLLNWKTYPNDNNNIKIILSVYKSLNARDWINYCVSSNFRRWELRRQSQVFFYQKKKVYGSSDLIPSFFKIYFWGVTKYLMCCYDRCYFYCLFPINFQVWILFSLI